MRFALWALVFAASCVRSASVPCADDRICAEGTRCVGDRCVPVTCGDGELQAPEVCDGSNVGAADCRVLGYYGANGLACSDVCQLDDSACEGGRCGDNIANGPEQCDLTTLASCGDFDQDVGRVTCAASCIVDTGGCERLGWSAMTSGTTRDLFGVWTASNDFAIAVGANGTIVHWDGFAWTPHASTTTMDLLAVSGSAPDNVIAVGRGGTILHWDGTAWSAMTSNTAADLRAVAVVAADRAFAAGAESTVLQLAASGWARVPNAPPGDWNAAWADASSLIVVGADSNARRYTGGWTAIEGPVTGTQDSYAVWGKNGNDVWIAGQGGRRVHYDNGSINASVISGFEPRGITGGDRFQYVVGGDGQILRFVMPGGQVFDLDVTRTTDELTAVHGSSASHVFAVGRNGRILRLIGVEHRDETTAANTTNTHYAAWGSAPNVMYVAGEGRSVWQASPEGAYAPVTSNSGMPPIRGLWGADVSRLIAVDEGGSILERVGTFGVVRTGVTGEALYAVWGASANDVFAVGGVDNLRGLLVTRRNGAAFTEAPLPPGTPPLYGITGTSTSNIYAAGEGGVILHYDGAAWTQVRAAVAGQRLNAIWMNGDLVVAAGTEIVMRHRDGWLAIPSERELRAVWGATNADVWVAGDAGTVMHFDGVSWVPLSLHSSRTIRAVAGSNTTSTTAIGPSNDVMLVGDTGFARRIIRFSDATEICTDRWDNDFDGLAGCADPDCDGHASCANGGRCRDALVATCGSVAGTTRGGPARLDVYPCADAPLLGTEAYYRFIAPTSGDVQVRITNADPDLVVGVLGVRSGACDPSACLAHGTDVTFAATAGEEYFLVVDGPPARDGEHVLDITCP